MKRKNEEWVDIHNYDKFEELLEDCVREAKYDDNPVPILNKVLREYRNYKECQRIINRLKKGEVKDGKE